MFCQNLARGGPPTSCHVILQIKEMLWLSSRAVVAQWIRPWTLNREVPGSDLLAASVVPMGKALHPHCPVPRRGLKAVGPLAACL